MFHGRVNGGTGPGKLDLPGGCHLQGLQEVERRAQDDESKANYVFEKLGCLCKIADEVY